MATKSIKSKTTKKPEKKAPLKKTSLKRSSVSAAKTTGTLDSDTMKTPVKSKRSYKYLLLGVVVLAIAAILYFAKGMFVAAMVNGRPVSRYTLIRNLEKTGGKQALEDMITRELITQEAKKLNIQVSDEDVQKEIERYDSQLKTQGSTLDAALTAQNWTKKDLEDYIKVEKSLQAILSEESKVNEEDIKKYYDDNKTQFGKDVKYDDLKESIKADLEKEKMSLAFQEWYQKLQSESDIKYFVSY